MDDDLDDLVGDEFDFEDDTGSGDALDLLLAANPANEGAAIWD